MDGPRVDIYVGPEKKHYRLPKNLLCYFSEYFDRCFNGYFTETQTQKLTLEEDRVDFFEVLLRYMKGGGVICEHAMTVSEHTTGEAGYMECWEFIEFADKFFLGDAISALYSSLEFVLPIYRNDTPAGVRLREYQVKKVDASDVKTVFRITSPKNPVRQLFATAALVGAGFELTTLINTGIPKDLKIDGFSEDLLAEVKLAVEAQLSFARGSHYCELC